MNFLKKLNAQDFMTGVVASLTAVVIWDVIKDKYKIFNYRKETE
jgi:hypothetical protein|tara:strand:- start:1169 stop:1300 length:132 start_codon:yes stop_codon:yes gene_type:complete